MEASRPEAAGDVFEDLRAQILSMALPPGTALSRADLQRRYGISTSPLRDALLRLQEQGLVEIQPQSHTRVSRIDLDQARQVQFLRSAVEERLAVQIARTGSPDLIRELDHLIALQQERLTRGDMKGFERLDLSFHEALFRHAGLTKLHRLIRRESGHIDRLRALDLMRPEKAQRIIGDHRAIAAAIASGEPEKARAAVEHHLAQSIRLGERLQARHPEFFTDPGARSQRGTPDCGSGPERVPG